MFAVANFISAVAYVLDWVFTALYWLILIRALASWLNPDPFNPVVQFLHASTEWMLSPLRARIPWRFRIGLDLSPVIAVLLILFLQKFLVVTLMETAMRMKLSS